MIKICLSLFVLISVLSCQPTEAASDLKNKATYSLGLKLYQARCAACHGDQGEPRAKLYPPLKNSDYLKNNQSSIPCIIKHGLEGEIIVNGQSYNAKMVGHSDLSALEISQLINYINNSWGNDYGFTSLEKVKTQLENCQK